MDKSLIIKRGDLDSQIIQAEEHLLNIRVKMGFEKNKEWYMILCITVPLHGKSWRDFSLSERNIIPTKLYIGNDEINELPVDLVIHRFEGVRFRIEFNLNLDSPIRYDGHEFESIRGKLEASYLGIRVHEGSSCYDEQGYSLLERVINTDEYKIDKPYLLDCHGFKSISYDPAT